MREEVDVRRRPADRIAGDDEASYTEGDAIIVPVIEERLEVRKVRYVVEEIEIRRQVRQEVQTIDETVRRERVVIEEDRGGAVSGAEASTAG